MLGLQVPVEPPLIALSSVVAALQARLFAPENSDAMVALNSAMMTDGCVIEIADGAGKAISIIGSAVDGFAKLAAFEGVPDAALDAFAAQAVASSIASSTASATPPSSPRSSHR